MGDKRMEQLRSLLKSYDERTAKLQVEVKPGKNSIDLKLVNKK